MRSKKPVPVEKKTNAMATFSKSVSAFELVVVHRKKAGAQAKIEMPIGLPIIPQGADANAVAAPTGHPATPATLRHIVAGAQKIEGSGAFLAGIKRPGCLYPMGTMSFQDWMDGWAQQRASIERLAQSEKLQKLFGQQ